jgi:phage baseplate assembly protein gpV
MSLRLGIVVETHAADMSVDLVMTDDGARIIGAQVSSLGASGRTGTVDLPEVIAKKNKWDITQRDHDGQDVLALVGYLGRNPIVIGFIFPQLNQMLFKDGKLSIYRHQSDLVKTIDGDGNYQISHPCGTYVRIGESPDKVDYENSNADKNLSISRNKDRKVFVRIGLADDEVVVTLSPDGKAKMTMKSDLEVDVGGNLSAAVAGTSLIDSTGEVTIKAPSGLFDMEIARFTGNMQVDKGIHAEDDIVADAVSLKNHKQTGVTAGSSVSGPPEQ